MSGDNGLLKNYLDDWDDDFGFVPAKPKRRLSGPAGSSERIADLRSRLESGECLWAPGDENVLSRYCEDYEWIIDQGVDTKVYSLCRRWLYRRWQYWNEGSGVICFVGNSHSELQWRRQLSLARRLGFAAIESVNLHAWVMYGTPHDGASTVGALCDAQISQAVMAANKTVLCWGDGGARGEYVAKAILRRVGIENIRTLGLDLAGNPLPIARKTTSLIFVDVEFFDEGREHSGDNTATASGAATNRGAQQAAEGEA